MTPTTRSLSLGSSALEFSYALIVLMEIFDKIDGWTIHVKRNDDATMRERHEKERERRERGTAEVGIRPSFRHYSPSLPDFIDGYRT